MPLPGDPPHALCPAYQEEEEAGSCWVSGGGGACVTQVREGSRKRAGPVEGESKWALGRGRDLRKAGPSGL